MTTRRNPRQPPNRSPQRSPRSSFLSAGEQLLQQTQNERDRILADGGEIEDGLLTGLVDPVLRTLDGAGQLPNLAFLGHHEARKVVSGSVSTDYDLSGGQNDATQSTPSKRPSDDPAGMIGDATDDVLENGGSVAISTVCYHFLALVEPGGTVQRRHYNVSGQLSIGSDGSGNRDVVYEADQRFTFGSTDQGGAHIWTCRSDEGVIPRLWVDGTELSTSDPSSGRTFNDGELRLFDRLSTATRPSDATIKLAMTIEADIASSLRSDLESMIADYHDDITL